MLSEKHNISSLISSNLARLCEARNRADNYVHLDEKGAQQQQPPPDDGPANQLAAADEVTRLARILLRLVNDTFLALPIEQCRTMWPTTGGNHHHEAAQEEAPGSHFDACLVDWNRASLINLNGGGGGDPSPLPPNQENGPSPTSSSAAAAARLGQDSLIESTWSRSSFMNTTSAAGQRTIKSPIEYDYVKLTYLSMSSLLSIFGILVNLFIILIIIFNTKQKRRSIIRSNNTNQNNLLLFQLTLTGILLSSHVLLENLSIQNTNNDNYTTATGHNSLAAPPPPPQDHLVATFEDPSAPPATSYQYSSHLFNFLPPTPFHTTIQQPVPTRSSETSPLQLTALPPTDSSDLCSCDDDHDDDELLGRPDNGSDGFDGSGQRARARHRFALTLDFSTTTTTANSKINDNKQVRGSSDSSWYLEYHVFRYGQPEHVERGPKTARLRKESRLIDLSDSLASISVGELIKSPGQHSIEQHDSSGSSGDHSDDDAASWRWERPSGFMTLLAIFMPWSMNVLASVHILTVAALAYDRYCAIAHPLHYLRSIHTSKVRTFFILSWTVAILLNLLWPLTLSQIQTGLGFGQSESILTRPHISNRTWQVTLNGKLETSNQESDSACRYIVFETGCSAVSSFSASNNNNNGSNDCRSNRKSATDTYRSLKVALAQFLNDLDRQTVRNDDMTSVDGDGDGDSYNNKTGSLVDELKMVQGWIRLRNSLMVELASLLIEQPSIHGNHTSGPNINYPSTGNEEDGGGGASSLYIIFLLAYSLLSFLVIILVPLLVITICNISIYRIVKVHERRLSINSGSNVNTSASNLNTGASNQFGSSLYHQCKHQQQVRVHRRENAPDDRSETGSITSVVMAKLIKIGFMFGGGGGSRNDTTLTRQEDDRVNVYDNSIDHESANQQQISNSSRLTTTSNCNNKLCGCDTRNNLSSNIGQAGDIVSRNEQQLDGGQYKLPASSSSSNIVNRSKRVMMTRQESYHQPSMAKQNSTGDEANCRYDEPSSRNSFCAKSESESNLPIGAKQSTPPVVFSPPCRRQRIKRKTSDQTPRELNNLRKDSNTSQLSDYPDNLADNCSLFNDTLPPRLNPDSTNRNYNQDPASSGIMNQIKLAGLSFAGIAIQNETATTRNLAKSSSLLKSSSCSLGSLNHIQSTMQFTPNNQATSVSRCSVETSSSNHTYNRKSYVSLNSHHVSTSKNQVNDSANGKYLTKLLDDDSDSAQTTHPGGVPTNFGPPHNLRLPFTLGTKSPAFNVVTWLILSLLIVTIPYYVLETVRQTRKLNSFYKYQADQEYAEAQNHQQLIGAMVEFLFEFDGPTQVNSTSNGTSTYEDLSTTTVDDSSTNFLPIFNHVKGLRIRDTSDTNFWEICSMWLSCICRILFLSILPLNGWLYGIRSRSLRATLRIVLKRYISRRQASIEINQRQRSITSIKSRESLFINLPPLYYNHNSSICAKCNYQITIKSPERVFRRCSSFTGLKRDNQSNDSNTSQPYIMDHDGSPIGLDNNDNNLEQSQAPPLRQSSCRGPNTIRFLIGDCSPDRGPEQFNTSLQQHSANDSMTQYCSQNTSPSLSLAGSDRSLVSASIYSAHSLLFDDRTAQDCTSVDLSHLNQRSIFKHSSALGRGSPTKLAHDVLEKEISELDQTLKVIFDNSRRLSSVKRFKADLENEPLTCLSPPKSSVYPTTTTTTLDCNTQKTSKSSDRNVTGIIRRGVGGDLIETNKPLISSANNFENTNSQGVRKSSEDFRFFITSAPDPEQHIVEFDHGDRICRKKNVTIDLQNSGQPQTRLADQTRNNTQLSGDWWKELKLNLTRLINVTSVRLLSSNTVEPQRRETVESGYGVGGGWRNLSSKQAPGLKDQGSRALLAKSSSSDDRGSSHDRPQDLLINPLGQFSDQVSSSGGRGTRTKKRLRNSLTLDDINSMKNHESKSHLECLSHQSSNSSSNSSSSGSGDYRNSTTKALDQSPCYLKPPNFLKLIFDPNSNTSHYSGPSALSPIKECSSNHSYASSQSSLNTNTHHLIYQPRREESLVSEYSNLME